MESKQVAAEKILNLAEERAKLSDFTGAKKLALEARDLFPSLPNLDAHLIAYDVHLTKKLPDGHNDSHAVLGLDRCADVSEIKKQGRKMCKLTHPDKNSSAAADSAFKIVKEAWNSLLSESSSSTSTTTSASVPNLKAAVTCIGCGIRNYWEFCLDHREKCLHYHCKKCEDWSPMETRPPVNFPLTCNACSRGLGWGPCVPFLHRCRNCDAESVVGANPRWIPGLMTPAPFRLRVPVVVCRPIVAPTGYVVVRGCLYPLMVMRQPNPRVR